MRISDWSSDVCSSDLAALSLPGRAARAAVPVADVPMPDFTPESGAELRVLRPAKFVPADETLFNENTKKFSDATGVPVKVDYQAWEDLRPQTAVTANTGAGPDVVLGWTDDPHLYSDKLIEITDIAEYLGAKYGGWYPVAERYGKKFGTENWVAIPFGGRSEEHTSELQSLMRISYAVFCLKKKKKT